MRQRAALIRTLLLDPELLEITSEGGNFHGTLRIRNFPVTDCPLLVADASLLA